MARKPVAKHLRCHGAFTLVELLVVIAIIAMLVSLLMPAVQQSREAGRRMNCSNNLKGISLALINFESTRNRFPPAGLVEPNMEPTLAFGDFDPLGGRMLSWIVLTLPFIEEQGLYDQFDLRRPIYEQPPAATAAQPQVLLCPADQAEGRMYRDTESHGVPLGKANYAAWVSPFHIDLQGVFPAALGGWGMELRKVTDGPSHTLMLSEVLTRPLESDQRGAWSVPWNASSLLAADAHHNFTDGGLRTFYNQGEFTVFFQTPNHRGPNLDTIYHCEEEANGQLIGMPCAKYSEGTDAWYLSSAPRSGHRVGVNASMMDGSVRFLPNNVSPIVFAYLVSVNDGQAVNETGAFIPRPSGGARRR